MRVRGLKRWLPIAVFALVCLSAAAWGLVLGRSPAASGSPAHGNARGAAAAPVTVAQVRSEDVPIELEAFGTVEASSTVEVVPQVTGLITEVHFREGAFVKKGDLLFSVDTRPYRASQAAAQAELAKSLALAQQTASEAERYLELERQGVATAQQRAQAQADAASARAQVNQLRAQLDSANLNVKFTRITAPIDGKTGALLVHAGNVIHANAPEPLVVIRSLSPVLVRFAVPQLYLPQIRQSLAGQPLSVRAIPRGDGAQPVQGLLTFMENRVDTATGTIALKATFTNADQQLWPGASVDVVLTLGSDRQALVVPAQAVRDAQDGSYVFVIGPDHKARQRQVEVLRTTPRLALLREGVKVGDEVVTDGYIRLRDGTPVAIQQPAPGPEHASAEPVQAGGGAP
ncbi:MAG TPA: efflux RND transporter periplasmic adaptor subunit [Polyangiaceae bacterium]|jgi:multidrug efflux system membrane fusion protein|nr:efflux RND transporter periplasmic adaptor subunit [Polyangiaceae bacterium]